MDNQDTECTVNGPLAITLQVSRIFGLAPIQFIKQSEGWRVRVSSAMCIYSYILILVLNISASFGLVLDLELEPERAVRVRTPTSRVVWIIELANTALITVIFVYTGPRRMRMMIACLNNVEKIHSKIGGRSQSKEKPTCIFAICCLVVSFSLYIFDYYMFMKETVDEDREVKIMYLYSGCYVELLMLVLFEMQFIYIGFSINFCFKWINQSLGDLIHIIDLQKKFKDYTNNEVSNRGSVPIYVKPVHFSVGRMTQRDKTVLKALDSSKVVQESVRSLSLLYCEVCDMVRNTDQGNGKVLLLLLGEAFLHLILTPYYLISFLLSSKASPLNLILSSLYCFYHPFKLIMVIEPGHRTEIETTRTRSLISQLLGRVSPRDPLTAELDLFLKQIVLNKVSYTPLGICTLNRPLLATIFGGVTTYLVIILQFQAIDKQYW